MKQGTKLVAVAAASSLATFVVLVLAIALLSEEYVPTQEAWRADPGPSRRSALAGFSLRSELGSEVDHSMIHVSTFTEDANPLPGVTRDVRSRTMG